MEGVAPFGAWWDGDEAEYCFDNEGYGDFALSPNELRRIADKLDELTEARKNA